MLENISGLPCRCFGFTVAQPQGGSVGILGTASPFRQSGPALASQDKVRVQRVALHNTYRPSNDIVNVNVATILYSLRRALLIRKCHAKL